MSFVVDQIGMNAQRDGFRFGDHFEIAQVVNSRAGGDRYSVSNLAAVEIGSQLISHVHHQCTFKNRSNRLYVAGGVFERQAVDDAGAQTPDDDRNLAVGRAVDPKLVEHLGQQAGPADYRCPVVRIYEIPIDGAMHVPNVGFFAEHVLNSFDRHVISDVGVCGMN